MSVQIKYHKTVLSADEFNEYNPSFQVRKIVDGLGIFYSYSDNLDNVNLYMQRCEDYNAVVINISKLIDPIYSQLTRPSRKHFLNVIIYIEKSYLIKLLEDEIVCRNIMNDSKLDENIVFQKKWLNISLKHLRTLEVSLFSTKIPNSYIEVWVHQYIYELALEAYKIISPITTTNFKQDDIQKIKKLEIDIKNTPFRSIPSINEMADNVDMSPTKFKKLFKETFGKSTHQYILDIKAEQAKILLETNQFSIMQVAYKVGFNHPSSLTRLIKNKYKTSPLKIRAKEFHSL